MRSRETCPGPPLIPFTACTLMFPQINSYYSVSYNQVNKVWGEEGSPFNMDITTGHVILNYMEDHLHDAERLNKEWEALCAYKADDR